MVVDYEKLRRHHQPRNVETDITVAAAAQSLQSSMMYNHITDGSLSQKRKRNEKKIQRSLLNVSSTANSKHFRYFEL